MNIYVYSDESGVFDKNCNQIYVYGGLIFLSKEKVIECTNRYSAIEKEIRTNGHHNKEEELKACRLQSKEKRRLYNCLNGYYKFGLIIRKQNVLDRIYKTKKDRQRFLDFTYKLSVKNAMEKLIDSGAIIPKKVENVFFYVDEHTTATNGFYELQEGLEAEFKNGTYNEKWDKFYPPIFPDIKSVKLNYCDSKKKYLVRAADIIANRLWATASFNIGNVSDLGIILKYYPKFSSDCL